MSTEYIVVLAITFILGGLAQKNPKTKITRRGEWVTHPDTVLALLLSFFLIFVAGFRYRVGTDFMAYYRTRVTDLETVWKSIITNNEPGLKLLSYLSVQIYDHGQTLIFVCSLITVGLYCDTIYRHSSMYLLSMALYILLAQWQSSFNGVRQYLASAILFAGFHFIQERRWAAYILVVLVAVMFHTSAVVMLLPYFLFTRKPDYRQFMLLAVGAVIFRFSYGLIFQAIGTYKGKLMDLSEGSYNTNEVNVLRIAVAFIPVAVYYFFCDKENHTDTEDFHINAIFFHAFTMLASMGSTYLARVGSYTTAITIIGHGYLLQLIREQRIRRIITVALLLIYLLYWYYATTRTGGVSQFRWAFE